MAAGSSHIFTSWLKFCLQCGKNPQALSCFAVTVLSCFVCMSKIRCISLGFPCEAEAWPWTASTDLISAFSWAVGDRAGHRWVTINSIPYFLLEASLWDRVRVRSAGKELSAASYLLNTMKSKRKPSTGIFMEWKLYGHFTVMHFTFKLLVDWWYLHLTAHVHNPFWTRQQIPCPSFASFVLNMQQGYH